MQIFVLEFSKDGSADQGDEFADGGATKQPMILQEGVCLSSGQMSQRYCQFQSTSNGFLKLVTDFLTQWCMHFSMRSKQVELSKRNFNFNKKKTVCIKQNVYCEQQMPLWIEFL